MQERAWGRIVISRPFNRFAPFRGDRLWRNQGCRDTDDTRNGRSMVRAGYYGECNRSGFFPTELTAAVFNDDARAARNAAQTCIGRNGCPEDMDGPILFLCSEASGYVTGQTLMVDGGFTAK